MILTFFNKNSRFRTVLRLSNELQKKRKVGKAIILAGLLVFSGSMFASGGETTKKAHLDAVSSLMIQDEAQGRIEPLGTFASDILRKISKQTSYNKMSAVEVLLGMSANPTTWQNEPIIKVANPQLAKEIGAVNDYVSYNQLFDFDNGGAYRLKELVDKVYQKEQSTHNKYDKEIINVDERVNICYQIFNGNMLALFPVQGHETSKWNTAKPLMSESAQGQVCPAGMGAMGGGMSASGGMGSMDKMTASADMGETKAPALKPGMEGATPPKGMGGMSDEQLSALMGKGTVSAPAAPVTNSPEELLSSYFKTVNEAMSSGNWAPANEQLLRIKSYQR